MKPIRYAALLTIIALCLTGCAIANDNAGTVSQTPPANHAEPSNPDEPSDSAPQEDPDARVNPEETELAAEEAAESGDAEAETARLYRMNNVYRFVPLDENAPDKVVLLTFDDGPKDENTLGQLLDTLDNHGAKAIFFVNGYRVKQNPGLLKLIHERGQTIGNHSYDHIDLKKEAEDTIARQLSAVQDQVEELTGTAPKFFRPPFGSGNDTVRQTAKNQGMLYMTWSNGSLDWDSSAKNKPEVVIRNVMEQLHPGANILMHELQWTADALAELLTKLEESGYGFIDPSTIELTD